MPYDTTAVPTSCNMVGTGPRGAAPVVLVHPVGLDLTYWGKQIEALSGEHDVVAYDLPGHGRSLGSPANWTLDKATRRLQPWRRWSGPSVRTARTSSACRWAA